MTTAQPVLRISGLTKHYGGVKALTGANFQLLPGEHAAIVGDNGAGKSTFVRLITGAEQPNTGDILLDGQKVNFESPLNAREQGIETVYQTLALAEDLDVPANIFLGREITRLNLGPLSILNHKAMREQSASMLATTGVKIQDMSESLRGMSGGQRQCVAVARAAAFARHVVIMDEPTAALGVKEGNMVLELIRRVRDRGLPVILISHNMPHVFEIADRIHIQRLGKRAAVVTPHTISMSDTVAVMTGAKTADELPLEAHA